MPEFTVKPVPPVVVSDRSMVSKKSYAAKEIGTQDKIKIRKTDAKKMSFVRGDEKDVSRIDCNI
jgi:hypothetical protein